METILERSIFLESVRNTLGKRITKLTLRYKALYCFKGCSRRLVFEVLKNRQTQEVD